MNPPGSGAAQTEDLTLSEIIADQMTNISSWRNSREVKGHPRSQRAVLSLGRQKRAAGTETLGKMLKTIENSSV